MLSECFFFFYFFWIHHWKHHVFRKLGLRNSGGYLRLFKLYRKLWCLYSCHGNIWIIENNISSPYHINLQRPLRNRSRSRFWKLSSKGNIEYVTCIESWTDKVCELQSGNILIVRILCLFINIICTCRRYCFNFAVLHVIIGQGVGSFEDGWRSWTGWAVQFGLNHCVQARNPTLCNIAYCRYSDVSILYSFLAKIDWQLDKNKKMLHLRYVNSKYDLN